MIKKQMTPSSKRTTHGFLSNFRRTILSNPLFNIRLSTIPAPNQRIVESPSDAPIDAREPDFSSTSESNVWSSPPPSNIPHRHLTPQQRRYASLFSKITISTDEFVEDRYVYSYSLDNLIPSEGLECERSESLRFFAIPSTRKPSIPSTGRPSIHMLDALLLQEQEYCTWGNEINSSISEPELTPIPACQEVFHLNSEEQTPELEPHLCSEASLVSRKASDSITDLLFSLSEYLQSSSLESSPNLSDMDQPSMMSLALDRREQDDELQYPINLILDSPTFDFHETFTGSLDSSSTEHPPRLRTKSYLHQCRIIDGLTRHSMPSNYPYLSFILNPAPSCPLPPLPEQIA